MRRSVRSLLTCPLVSEVGEEGQGRKIPRPNTPELVPERGAVGGEGGSEENKLHPPPPPSLRGEWVWVSEERVVTSLRDPRQGLLHGLFSAPNSPPRPTPPASGASCQVALLPFLNVLIPPPHPRPRPSAGWAPGPLAPHSSAPFPESLITATLGCFPPPLSPPFFSPTLRSAPLVTWRDPAPSRGFRSEATPASLAVPLGDAEGSPRADLWASPHSRRGRLPPRPAPPIPR